MCEAFANPEEYVIQRTTGVFVLHQLFVKMIDCLSSFQKDYTKDNFKSLIESMDKGTSDLFWHRNGQAGRIGTSQKAFKQLAKELERSLEAGLFSLIRTGGLLIGMER